MSDLLIRERQGIILERLNSTGKVLAAKLADEFSISEDTIRRDLRELAARGLCERVYGGALLPVPSAGTMTERQNDNTLEKCQLGALLAEAIEDHMTVFLDASSTNLAAARAVTAGCTATIVTNSPVIAAALSEKQALTVIMIGGTLHHNVGGAVDAKASGELAAFCFDLCILGACGLDTDAGLTCFHYEDALFKQAAAARSNRAIAAMTADKFATRAPYSVLPLVALDGLAIGDALDEQNRAILSQAGIRLIKQTPEDRPS